MSAKKQASSDPDAGSGSASRAAGIFSGRGRFAMAAVVIVAAVGGSWHFAWQHVRGHVLAENDYQLDPLNIEISPLPSWIHADVRAEVVRDANLDGSLSIVDPELTLRIKQAFKLHPWVAEVERVSKRHPAAVDVELVYRRPAAMVEVPRGLLPVDAEGVLLPSDDFSANEAKVYPRISGIKSVPAGPVGARWPDPRVIGAAALAAALAENWQALKLYRIVPSPVAAGGRYSDDYTYDLVTHGGTQIHWGLGPTSKSPGEISTTQKHAKLMELAGDPKTWDAAAGEIHLVAPAAPKRTAIKPLPKRDDAIE